MVCSVFSSPRLYMGVEETLDGLNLREATSDRLGDDGGGGWMLRPP